MDKEKADELYVLAYDGFVVSLKKEEDKNGNLEYKIGKMSIEGKGTEQDFGKGIQYIQKRRKRKMCLLCFFC